MILYVSFDPTTRLLIFFVFFLFLQNDVPTRTVLFNSMDDRYRTFLILEKVIENSIRIF